MKIPDRQTDRQLIVWVSTALDEPTVYFLGNGIVSRVVYHGPVNCSLRIQQRVHLEAVPANYRIKNEYNTTHTNSPVGLGLLSFVLRFNKQFISSSVLLHQRNSNF
jgi:hypothetical protein